MNIGIFRLALAAVTVSVISSNAVSARIPVTADRPAVVLVHGAWQTGTAWWAVKSRLRADGYRVITVNLPGRPGAPLAASAVSLALYRDTVIKAIKQERRPVVLVGHSFGGVTISNVAESVPERIKTLVYVAAFLPQNGMSLLDMAKADRGSLLPPHLKFDAARGVVSIDAAIGGGMFANDGTARQQASAAAHAVDEPLAPLATPVKLTAERFGKADRVYIKTLRDRAVSPTFQDMMIASGGVRLVIKLDTGHLPYLTNPGGLAAAIERAAR